MALSLELTSPTFNHTQCDLPDIKLLASILQMKQHDVIRRLVATAIFQIKQNDYDLGFMIERLITEHARFSDASTHKTRKIIPFPAPP